MRRHPGIRQQRRVRLIKELAAVVIFITAIYITQVADSIDFRQITIQDRLPELGTGFLVMLAAGIIYITTRHLENFRKK